MIKISARERVVSNREKAHLVFPFFSKRVLDFAWNSYANRLSKVLISTSTSFPDQKQYILEPKVGISEHTTNREPAFVERKNNGKQRLK